MSLISRGGERLRISPAAKLYSNAFSFQVISSDADLKDVFSADGTVRDDSRAELEKRGLLVTRKTSIFEKPSLCESMFGWDASGEFSFIKSQIPRPGRVLDVGCGWGRLLKCCEEAQIPADGFDVSDALAEYARSRVSQDTGVFVSDFQSFCAPGRYVMAYAAMNTLRYASVHSELYAHFRNMQRTLVVGGKYLVQTTVQNRELSGTPVSWRFQHHDRSYIACWKHLGVDGFYRHLFEEVTLIDEASGAKYREIQKQLMLTADDLVHLSELSNLAIEAIFDAEGASRSLKDIQSGRYWIVFARQS